MRFNYWRWWRQYRPSLIIVKCDDLHIRIDDNKYYLELRVDIECNNRSDRHEADYDSDIIVVYTTREKVGKSDHIDYSIRQDQDPVQGH